MDPKTSTKAISISLILLCLHVVAMTTTACNNFSSPTPSPSSEGPAGQGQQLSACPKDALKLGVCIELLAGLVVVKVGTPPTARCCALLGGLADLEVAACLCTAVRANILGIGLKIPITLSPLLNACDINRSQDFVCGSA